MQRWVWRDGALADGAGEVIARVNPTGLQLSATGTTIAFEHIPGARSFTVRGPEFSAEQTSFTVNKLRALCQGREYLLERTNPFRRQRRILALSDATSAEVARTTPRGRDLEVAVGELPLTDAVFTSYCCLLLDGPTRPFRT
ncbi:hypothetical protein GCM10009604_03700 [Corynebacterium aurimucosum]|uniref:hypothetical protein n=1 Tax=Corynebacterium aurimucosum TaxID=169292 RepID=UPI00191FAD9A|nr:hypothetical protein [Corynebacterium aurimucosum]QQU96620.1 hypothetical protein I6I66_06015 [Corynebacterium aurimucosum]UTA70496.1 hypothetical protein J3S22_06685 [Corynebacterium aurimucosum]WJY71070.1 hypothetical protein CAURIM_09860 [Corynebacterium aurimucosum]